MQMIMLVLDDPDLLDEVVGSWRSAGVTGATILESMGAYRRETEHVRGRYLFGMPGLAETAARAQYTLFAIVPDRSIAELALQATEEITGDLNQPNTGVFAAWELSMAKGLPDNATQRGSER